MSVAGAIALRACEQASQSVGSRAGLVAYKALAQSSADVDTRAKALIGALRCAIALRDGAAVEDLLPFWVGIDRGDWPVTTLVRELVRARMSVQAISLAEAEAGRHRTAHSLYTCARAHDVARDGRAVEWFRKTIRRAQKEGNTRIETAARARLVALLARSWETLDAALAEAAMLDPKTVADPIELARVLLFSGSRFTRAGAIGILADAAKSDDIEIRLRARRLAARYVDEAADSVTPLEQDRLSAFLKDALGEKLAPDIEARAEDILRGRYEVPREDVLGAPSDPRARRLFRHDELLDVVVAMRDRAPARAARSLRPLALAIESGERLPREALAVTHAALLDGDRELADVAIRIAKRWLARPSYAAPPRGYLALAEALADANEPDLALLARRAAATRKEANAVASLATILTRVGWEAARSHDRAHAIRLLREAKGLILKG
ncbi:MAG: hypothetical protein U0270_45015 [Labilithrix sp.]